MLRLGVVSFLNARPLVWGLDQCDDVHCTPAVPAALGEMLASGTVDAALLPVVDLLRSGGRYRSVSNAGIGCDGETMTVRVFSRVPPHRITTLAVDADSHTSVALARVLWRRLFEHDLTLEVVETRQTDLASHEAVLLIGDKVVAPGRGDFGYEVDLGGAWRAHTGLPFVFAVWAAGPEAPTDLAATLESARDAGVAHAAEIAAREGPEHGWPVELAQRYLTQSLRFTIDDRARAGMEQFAAWCRADGLVGTAPRKEAGMPGSVVGARSCESSLSLAASTGPSTVSEEPSPGASGTGARLSDAEALELYRSASIHELGRMAFERLEQLHPEPYRTYVVDRNINYANVCTARCTFCNFYRKPGDDEAYILSFDEIGRKIEELQQIGGTQILMQGGLVPDDSHPTGHGLPFAWYLDLLRYIKKYYPGIHVHAFSPPEIWAFHQIFNMPLRDVLLRLQEAGLDTIPGGGGEILVERVRQKIGRGKATTDQWLEVMRAAHQIGMQTSCTMMFGHIETLAERIEHMRRLRELQDETGGFVAFIHWPFQPEGTPLGRWKQPVGQGVLPSGGRLDEGRAEEETLPPPLPRREGSEMGLPLLEHAAFEPDGEHLFLADAQEYLRLLAVARLYLDNIPNIQSSWVTMGPKIGQLALLFGANDMGSVMMEENVVSAAGTTYRLNEDEIRRLIVAAGWTPQQRDQYYRPIETRRAALT